MTHFLNTTRCTISTLSPVHIGCGEDYYPTNYVIDGGFLHHFGEEALLKSLNPIELSNLVKLANEANEENLTEIQKDIYEKKDQLKTYATHSVPVSKGLEVFYKSRVNKPSQQEVNGKNVKHKLEIARHTFKPYNNQPYFPGSSIKGAIRTALLNYQNTGSLPFRVDEKTPNNKLQQTIFGHDSIQSDPLRLLKISDASYAHADNLHSSEIRFAVNRKNKVSKFEAKGLNQLLECLSAHRSRALAFDLTFLANQNQNFRWTLREICNACNEFFVPQLERELEMLQQINYCNPEWARSLEKLLANELGEAFRNQQAFLLRIGQHGGAESNTLDGVRHIKIKISDKPAKYEYRDKPTTIWLAANNKDQQHDLLPFGWVLVEIGNHHLEKTEFFLTEQCCSLYPSYKQQITAKRKAERERLESELAQAEAEKKANMKNSDLITELQEEFKKSTPQNQPIGGTLNPKLTALINQAANWSSEDKQALFNLGTEINKTLWSSNKNVKNRLKTLQG